MNLLAKAEAIIFSAAHEIYQHHLPLKLPNHILQEILTLYPLSQTEIRDRIEWYIIDFSLSRSFYDIDKNSGHSTYDLLGALLDYETTTNGPCPNIFDLEPNPAFSFEPGIASLLPHHIKKEQV